MAKLASMNHSSHIPPNTPHSSGHGTVPDQVGQSQGQAKEGRSDEDASWHWKTSVQEDNSDTEEQKALCYKSRPASDPELRRVRQKRSETQARRRGAEKSEA